MAVVSSLLLLLRLLSVTTSVRMLVGSRELRIVCGTPNFLVKVIMRLGWLRSEVFEILGEGINTHLANTLTISATYVNTTLFGFFLTSNENVIPLVELSISDLLVKLGI